MTLKQTSSDCHQMSTPPDSPTKGLASSQATVKHLKHLFDVLSKVLPDLTNRGPTNTHVFQEHHQPGPGMVQLKQLLVKLIDDGYSSFGHFVATKPAQFYLADNQLGEDAQAKNARRGLYDTTGVKKPDVQSPPSK